tara:strand:+ start:21 stop:449 length:429 start_codon:yes stop_codon:yes gene_type:complete
MYDNEEVNNMAERDKDLTLYSQTNSMAAYVGMIRFALERLEVYIDDIGDGAYFGADRSPFPADVLGDDTLFAGYTNPWDPDDDDDDFDEFGAFYASAQAGCDCDDCRCKNADAKIKPESMSVGNIMDMLYKTRKSPPDYRMD